MIKKIKGFLFLLRQWRKQKKLSSDIFNAQKHAILSLKYLKHCEKECDLDFQIENLGINVRLGKGVESSKKDQEGKCLTK